MDYVAGKGTTGMSIAGLTTGIIGTLGAIGGLAAVHGGSAGSSYVTKDELNYVSTIAAKDASIALLQSEKEAESKMVEVYTALAKQDKDIRAELQSFKDAQYGVNASQGAINAVNAANIACLQKQIGGITQVVVPNASVMPGWGEVTVAPKG